MTGINNQQNRPAENKKKGFGFLSGLFRFGGSGASSVGGVGSGAAGTAFTGGLGLSGASGSGFFASLLATKAGIAGLVIGGLTLLVGAGIIYNVAKHNSGDLAGQGIFNDPYYDSVVSDAERARADRGNTVAGRSASLDYFKESAKGVFSNPEAASAKADKAGDNEYSEAVAEAAADAPANPLAGAGSMAKLQAGTSFENSGGGSSIGSAAPAKAAGVSNSDLNAGRAAATGAISKMASPSAIRGASSQGSGRKAVGGGAGAQAKAVADKLANKGASYGSQRAAAIDAYENTGTSGGDPDGVSVGGVGTSGSGISSGANVPTNPSTVTKNVDSPSTVDSEEGEDDSPWSGMAKMAIVIALIGIICVVLASKFAKTWNLWVVRILAAIGVLCGLALIGMGAKLMFGDDQMLIGGLMMGVGAILTVFAALAYVGAGDGVEAEATGAASTSSAEAGTMMAGEPAPVSPPGTMVS